MVGLTEITALHTYKFAELTSDSIITSVK